MKGPRTSRQTRRRNADCSVGLVNVAQVVETFFISEILSLSRRLTKASTKASRPVVWTPLLNAVEMSAMWRRLSIVLGSSANCFWTLDPSRLKPPSRKSVVVSVKQGTHVSQCSAAGPHRFWRSNQGRHEAAACWSRSSLCSREPQSSISFGRFLSGMTEKRSSR